LPGSAPEHKDESKLSFKDRIWQFFKDPFGKSKNKDQNKNKPQGTTATFGNFDPNDLDPDDEDKEKSSDQNKNKYKRTNYEKGDDVGIERFTIRFEKNKFRDPKTGQYIQKDKAVNSGAGSHGGSEWKLFDKSKKQIGTISSDGKWLRY
jgi:hypothetical protein